jgi:hypothetical protein
VAAVLAADIKLLVVIVVRLTQAVAVAVLTWVVAVAQVDILLVLVYH